MAMPAVLMISSMGDCFVDCVRKDSGSPYKRLSSRRKYAERKEKIRLEENLYAQMKNFGRLFYAFLR
jgi:hypothetical protein